MTEFDYREDDGIIGGLCIQCNNAEGPYSSDRCGHYKMPLFMVYRKNKCKHFKEIRDWEGGW